jgi:hypothetical protein
MLIALMIILVIIALIINGLNERGIRRSSLQKVAKSLGFDYMSEPSKLNGQEILNNLISYDENAVPYFEDLICGMRREYRFNVIRVPGPHGGSYTIICVYLKVQEFCPFAILKTLPEKMPPSMQYLMTSKLNNILSKHKVVTDCGVIGIINLPESFLSFFVNSPEYGCEYHSGKLLVFRPCHVIAPDDISESLDSAVRLAAVLDGM